MSEKRRDKCKCGRFITWSPWEDNEVTCKHCGTKYRVEGDSVMVWWLEERVATQTPYRTEAR